MIRPVRKHPAAAQYHERLLLPGFVAISATATVAFVMLHAMQQSAAFDLTGRVESVIPLARLGVVTSPLIVAFRAVTATAIAWLVAGTLDAQVPFKSIAIGVLTWMPLLELPALIDAVALMRHPQMAFTDVHIRLGLDAIMTADSNRLRVLAQTVNPALLAFTALLARHLTKHGAAKARVALAAAAGAAAALVVMPLLRA